MQRAVALGLVLGLSLSDALATEPAEPLDALAYTVVQTPPAEQVPLPTLSRDRNVRSGLVRPFPDRVVPDVFWFDNDGVRYGLVYQNRPAPLVVLIAGTGGSFNSESNRQIARALYAAGMHVLGLPSPTHPNFIINGSESGVVGRPPDDARDLRRVVELALRQITDGTSVTAVHLAGFSLGALQAGWLAELDARERRIGFDRVLMINPPVSLSRSAAILDDMFDRNVDEDPRAVAALVDRIFRAFAAVYSPEEDISLDGEFLYRAYETIQPSDATLETLIGIAFRFSSTNLTFTSDVMSHAGYIVSPDANLTYATSLTDFFKHTIRKSFDDYIEGIYLPHFQARIPGFDRARAIEEASLLPIEGFLRNQARVGLITNRDDIILAPGDLAWLERVFGERATILPSGGHGGNLLRGDFVAAVAKFFRG
jgi:pimeloyl-ACP methyl ester carboxylesterase